MQIQAAAVAAGFSLLLTRLGELWVPYWCCETWDSLNHSVLPANPAKSFQSFQM